jgi:hypothetical protein
VRLAVEDLVPKVDRVDEETVFTPGVGGQQVVRVTYHVGADGPFTMTWKKAEFSASAVKAEMEQRAAILRALRG